MLALCACRAHEQEILVARGSLWRVPINWTIRKETARTRINRRLFAGQATDEIAGTTMLVTMDELLKADAYEPPEYQRVSACYARARVRGYMGT